VRLTRRGRLTVTVTVVALLLATAGVAFLLTRTRVGAALGLHVGPPCELTTAEGDVHWSAREAMSATTLAAVGVRIGATENGVAAAVRRGTTARRDAVLDAEQARQVYRGLPDRARPSREALAVGRALLGLDGPALTCTVPELTRSAALAVESPGPAGLTPRAAEVRADMRTAFGRQSLGGFDPGGVTTGHVPGSAHYEGRAMDVFFRPISAASTRLGWVQAQWAVAHAERLGIATVIFDRQIWSARRSLSGWRDYRYPGGATDNPVLLHEDHVHIDVLRGGTFG
jgi:hypothetical protein